MLDVLAAAARSPSSGGAGSSASGTSRALVPGVGDAHLAAGRAHAPRSAACARSASARQAQGPVARAPRRDRRPGAGPRHAALPFRPADPRPRPRPRRSGTSSTGSRCTSRRRSAEYGYYVLPLLVGDRLVGRDRAGLRPRRRRRCACSAPGATPSPPRGGDRRRSRPGSAPSASRADRLPSQAPEGTPASSGHRTSEGGAESTTDLWTYRDSALIGNALVGLDVEALDGEIGKVDEATDDAGTSAHRGRHRRVDLRQEGVLPAGVIDRVDLDEGEGLRQPDEGRDQERARVRRRAHERRGYRAELGAYYGDARRGSDGHLGLDPRWSAPRSSRSALVAARGRAAQVESQRERGGRPPRPRDGARGAGELRAEQPRRSGRERGAPDEVDSPSSAPTRRAASARPHRRPPSAPTSSTRTCASERSGRPAGRGGRRSLQSRRGLRDARDPRGPGAGPGDRLVIVPIYQTSTYVQEAVGEHKGYDYSRVANPTRTALQLCLASLEGAEHGIAFSSGLGATTTLMHLLNPGDRVVLIADVYGGVYRMTSQVYEPKGYLFEYVRPRSSANLARAPRRAHAHGLDRDAVEPDAEHRRHRRGRRGGARGRRDPRRRQHLRHAVPPAAARARRRRRRPLDDEVPRRALRRHRRLRRDERPDDRRAPLLPAEVARRRPRPVRLLARAARGQDARDPHAQALRERARDRRVPRAPPARRARALPRAADAPRPRDRRAPDARLRRDDLDPRRLGGGGRRDRRPDEALPARRVARRRREPHRAPRADDARLDRRRAVRRAPEPDPAQRRDRVGRTT